MKAPALRSILFLILTSAIAASAAAQTATIKVAPAAPTTDDVVTLDLSGSWPDSCAPGAGHLPAVKNQDGHVNVLYVRPSGACATVITPWSLALPLGRLAAGTYSVDFVYAYSLIPPETLASATFTVSEPQAVHVFAPSFQATGAVTIASRLTAFNNGSGGATVGLVAAYDAFGRHDLSDGGHPLAPGASERIATESLTPASVRFVEIATTSHVAFRAALERSAGGVLQGRVGLPVFTSLFPAGNTVVAGDVQLHDGFRRANLTLFNAGTSPASFQIEVTSGSGAPLVTRSVTLAAQSTEQVNALLDATAVVPGGPSSVWIRVTADQPFLAYASAVYTDAAPGAIPYEIFAARPEL